MKNGLKYRPVGTNAGHKANCNCDQLCKPNRRFNDKLLRMGARQQWTRDDIQPHVQNLVNAVGGVPEELCRQTGLSHQAILNYVRGGPQKVPANIARILMDTTAEHLTFNPNGYPKDKFRWRVRVLGAQGYPLTWLCKKMGISMRAFHLDRETVNPELWAALDELWKLYSGRMADVTTDGLTPYAISMAKSRATKLGFRTFAAYDNEYDEKPADTASGYHAIRADRRELQLLVERRVRAGMLRNEIRDELQGIYPDVISWEHLVDSAQTQVRRENAQLSS